MDRFTSMAVFKRTVEAGSFVGAARHFGISAEMAGNHVRELEKHLGVRLLNHTTRHLNLTDGGSSFYARCVQILADLDEAETEAHSLQATPRGLLRIAGPVTFGVRHITPAIGEYLTRYPEVKIEVTLSDRRVSLVEEGFNLAIRIGDLEESSLIVRRLSSAHLVVCASPAYLLRAGRPQLPGDLGGHACLIYTETSAPTTWRFEGPDGRREAVHVSGPVASTNPEVVHQLALAGHGVVLAPSFTVGMDIAEGRLTALLTDWRARALPIYALYPHRSLLSAKVRTFVDFLVDRFGPNPEWERWRDGV